MVIHQQRRDLVAVMLAAAGLLGACSNEPGRTGGAPAPAAAEVDVLSVQPRALEISQELPGRISAVRTVDVRARVAGIVLSRHFQEGADVRAGQLLFRIEPAPYKVALARAQAELAKADALQADALAVVGRYAPLAKVKPSANKISRRRRRLSAALERRAWQPRPTSMPRN